MAEPAPKQQPPDGPPAPVPSHATIQRRRAPAPAKQGVEPAPETIAQANLPPPPPPPPPAKQGGNTPPAPVAIASGKPSVGPVIPKPAPTGPSAATVVVPELSPPPASIAVGDADPAADAKPDAPPAASG